MGSERTAETTIEAPLGVCLAVILDISAYPDWVRGYRSAAVEERDDRGRPVVAGFEVGGFGMAARYRLAYVYLEEPVTVAFRQLDGDLTRSVDGRYELRPAGNATHVRYAASVELAMPMPRVARAAAEKIVLDAAVRSLRGEAVRRHGSRTPAS